MSSHHHHYEKTVSMPMPHPFPGAILKTSGTQSSTWKNCQGGRRFPWFPHSGKSGKEETSGFVPLLPHHPFLVYNYPYFCPVAISGILYYSRVETGVHSFPSSRCHRYQDLFTQSTFMCGSQVSNTLPVHWFNHGTLS